MASISKSSSVSVPTIMTNANEFSPNMMMNLSSSVPIRAPITMDDSDSDFDLSSDVTLSETSSHSDLEQQQQPHYTSQQQQQQDEECFEFDEQELSPLVQPPLRVTPFAPLSTYEDDEDEDDEDEDDDNEIVEEEISETLHVVVNQSLVTNNLTFLDDRGSNVSIDCGANGLRVACDGYSTATATDSDVMSQCSQDSLENEQFGKVRVALNKFENDDMKLYGLDRDNEIRVELIETNDIIETNMVEEISKIDLLESNAEGYNEIMMALQNTSGDYFREQNSQTGENIEDNSITTQGIEDNESQCVNSHEESESENLISITKSGLVSKAILHDSSDMVEEISNNGLLESNAEGYIHTMMLKQNRSVNFLEEQIPETGESLSDVFAENIEYSTAANGSRGVAACHHGSESENLVSITKYVVDSKAILHDSSVGFESNGDACECNKIQGVEYYELSDPALLQECTYLENGLSETVLGVVQEDELFCDYHSHENVETFNLGDTVNREANMELNTVSQEFRRDGSDFDEDLQELMSVRLEQFREQISALSILLGSKGSEKNSHEEQTVWSPCGRTNLAEDDGRSQLIYFDNGSESDCNSGILSYADQANALFLNGPASFSSSPGVDDQAGFQHNISEEEKEKIQKIQTISVIFLRLVQRINFSLEDSLVSKVLCKLVADIGRRSNQEFVITSAKILAKKLEEDAQDDLDISLNILVLGKSGVGKSATINSIFGDMMVMTNAFEPSTTSVREVSGTIDGVKIRILDTPGLRSPMKEQAFNRKILSSVKRYMKKFPLDVILYVDRVDFQTTDLNDLPILRSITSSLGPSVWQHAILTLTHAASTPLDGPSGTPLSYEVLMAQKSSLVQQSIIKAVGDQCQLSPSFMCPVSLVENHPLCGKTLSGDSVLPNGLRWRSQLLALCFSQKILSEVSSISLPCTLFDHWKHLLFDDHSEPLCHLCSCLLQSPSHHLKFSANWN